MSYRNDDTHVRAVQFEIFPNEEQKRFIEKTIGCARKVYNLITADKLAYYEKTNKNKYFYPASYKKTYPYLEEVDSSALANVQVNADRAFSDWKQDQNDKTKKVKKGKPRFKKKGKCRPSYTTSNTSDNIKLKDGKLKLPKMDWIDILMHRPLPSWAKEIKKVTVFRTPIGTYKASILFKYEIQAPTKVLSSVLGLDFSMSDLYVDSEGFCANYPKFFRKKQEKLAKEQRKLSRCKKGSKNYFKQLRKVNKIHYAITNQRKDYLHKLTTYLANNYDVIAIETLNLKGMASKDGFKLGKSVHDVAFSYFTSLLGYKLNDRGGKLEKVDRFFPSSQTCNHCHNKFPITKDLSVRQWECPNCHSINDRDANAAKNIRDEAMRLLGITAPIKAVELEGNSGIVCR
ncbi:MAG: RNA-guided endonuclease TnpB family protein [Succinivibrio sp.]|nr:RNA-guided endonuclease TnpB family protein [Succinivibrio sp.]